MLALTFKNTLMLLFYIQTCFEVNGKIFLLLKYKKIIIFGLLATYNQQLRNTGVNYCTV